MLIASIDASNKADWIVDITATDADSGVAIDFTGANITVVLQDENGNTVLTGTTGNGKVTLPVVGTIEFHFTSNDMATLQPASYSIGCVYNINSVTTQLFTGSVSVYDGIASI